MTTAPPETFRSTPSSQASLLDSTTLQPSLAAVEALMLRLCRGTHDDVIGPMCAEHLATGGKRLRARLALAGTEALGSAYIDAVGWAAACELAHNATLVHDDLQDGDRIRRGQPTTWVRHGAAQAINAGDLMFMLPLLAIHTVPKPASIKAELSRALGEGIATVVRGQASEWAMTQAMQADWTTYTAAIDGKTSALFQLPVEGAALIAGFAAHDAAALSQPFCSLGRVFQMQDDLVDLYGDKGRDARGSDLREGKVSILVVEHLRLHPEDGLWLTTLLRTPREETAQSDVDLAIDKFRTGGALAAALARVCEAGHAARTAPVFEQRRALQQLMCELLDRVLQPIAPLLGAPGIMGISP